MQLFIKLPSQANNYKNLFESGQLGDANTKDLNNYSEQRGFTQFHYSADCTLLSTPFPEFENEKDF